MKINWKYVMLGIVLIISIKPILFTWNFIQASYYFQTRSPQAAQYMERAMAYKPSVYKIFNDHAPRSIENYRMKEAILRHNPKLLESFKGVTRYEDNFYYRNLLGQLNITRNWANLDEVSFELLEDPKMNAKTMTILKTLFNPSRNPNIEFTHNLADFAWWQGNKSLSQDLVSTYALAGAPFKSEIMPFNPGDINKSIKLLKAFMLEKYKLKADQIGENLLPCGGFESVDCIGSAWTYSMMASSKEFSRGSFYIGPDSAGKNSVMRIMGFFNSKETGKSFPRAGVRALKKIQAENGCYVFSFDFYVRTGNEKPSFWLAKGLIEERPRFVANEWINVIFVVNNLTNQYDFFQPLVRMWGTGTMLVDNVFFAKIASANFSINTPYESYVHLLKRD